MSKRLVVHTKQALCYTFIVCTLYTLKLAIKIIPFKTLTTTLANKSYSNDKRPMTIDKKAFSNDYRQMTNDQDAFSNDQEQTNNDKNAFSNNQRLITKDKKASKNKVPEITRLLHLALVRHRKHIVCYEQALTTLVIARLFKLPATIHFGLAKEGNQAKAHAWSTLNNKPLTGHANKDDYTEIYKVTYHV